jgi:hypothetical protein
MENTMSSQREGKTSGVTVALLSNTGRNLTQNPYILKEYKKINLE